MLHVCLQLASIVQYLKHNLPSPVTSALDLLLHTIKFCSLLFCVVVHAGCNKQDFLMRGSLHGKWIFTLTAINRCTVDCGDC